MVVAIQAASVCTIVLGFSRARLAEAAEDPADVTRASVPALAGAWNVTGSLLVNRQGAPAVLLDGGQVLLCGGMFPRLAWLQPEIADCEIWNPVTAEWRTAGALTRPRAGHAAARLRDGQVLFVGGDGEGTAEVWELRSGRSRPTPKPTGMLLRPQALALQDGRVLVWSDELCHEIGSVGAQALLFDPVRGTWLPVSRPMADFCLRSAALLPDGSVAAAGNVDQGVATGSGGRPPRQRLRVARFFPAQDRWTMLADIDFDPARLLVVPDVDRRQWRVLSGAASGDQRIRVAYLFDLEGRLLRQEQLPAGLMAAQPRGLPGGGVLFQSGGDFILGVPATQMYRRLPPLPANAGGGTWAALPDGRLLLAGGWPLGQRGGRGIARVWDPAARGPPVVVTADQPPTASAPPPPEQVPNASWKLGTLVVTGGLVGGAVAASYLTRDHPFSRGLAITSSAASGTLLGGLAGAYSNGGGPIGAGFRLIGGLLLGGAIGGAVGTVSSRQPGAPRVATTAVALAPVLILAVIDARQR
jgi:hypothetical protein